MFPEWTERAHVTRTIVNQSVTDHFVLALEPFAAFTTGTTFDGAIVWTT